MDITEFPKHIRKGIRKQFKNNEYCPKCNQITSTVKEENGYFYCSWCNRVFKNGKIIEKKELMKLEQFTGIKEV